MGLRVWVDPDLVRIVRLLTVAALVITITHSTAVAQRGGKKGGSQTHFKVCVLFDDEPDDGVFSDDSTMYCNRGGKITAIVGDGFRLDTNKSTRTVGFDFGSNGPGPFGGSNNGFASIDMRIERQYLSDEFGNLILDADGQRQSAGHRLAVGQMEVGEIARAALNMVARFDDANGNEQSFKLAYAWSPGSVDEFLESAPVKVTRWPDNVWTIETVSSQDEWNGGVAALSGDGIGGAYSMPFGLSIYEKD